MGRATKLPDRWCAHLLELWSAPESEARVVRRYDERHRVEGVGGMSEAPWPGVASETRLMFGGARGVTRATRPNSKTELDD